MAACASAHGKKGPAWRIGAQRNLYTCVGDLAVLAQRSCPDWLSGIKASSSGFR